MQPEAGPEMIDRLFDQANTLVSSLSTRPSDSTFYDFVDRSSKAALDAWRAGAARLFDIGTHAPSEKSSYIKEWAADAFTGAGDFDLALEIYPTPKLGGAVRSKQIGC